MIISKAPFLSKVLEDTLWQNKGVIKEREVQRMEVKTTEGVAICLAQESMNHEREERASGKYF